VCEAKTEKVSDRLIASLRRKISSIIFSKRGEKHGERSETKVAKLAGVSRSRINKGIEELEYSAKPHSSEGGSGGGRKSKKE